MLSNKTKVKLYNARNLITQVQDIIRDSYAWDETFTDRQAMQFGSAKRALQDAAKALARIMEAEEE